MGSSKFGILYTHLEDIIGGVELAEKAESWGYDSYWVPDLALDPNLEPFSLLAAISQKTSRILLGTSVIVIPYKHPVMLAKSVTTLDVLSQGRLILGVGIGHRQIEFEAMNLDIHKRAQMADDKLEMLRRLLSEKKVTHKGVYHRVENVTIGPRPVQQPSPPIWIGPMWRNGFAEGVLRRTAKYGDGFLPSLVPPEGYRLGQQKIRTYAEQYGRDPDSIEWGLVMWICIDEDSEKAWDTMSQESFRRRGMDPAKKGEANAIGTPDECLETIRAYLELGVTHFVLNAGTPPTGMADQYKRFALEVLPKIRGSQL